VRIGRSCGALDGLVVCELGRTGGEVWLTVDRLLVPHTETFHCLAGMTLAILHLFAAVTAEECFDHHSLQLYSPAYNKTNA
jgi:hypothetical protein